MDIDNNSGGTEVSTGFFRGRFKKDFGVVFSGKVLSVAFGFVTTMIVARHFSVAEFGILTSALIVMQIASAIASLAIDNGLVRFLSLYLETDRGRAGNMLKVAFHIRICSSLVVLVGGYFLAPFLAIHIFNGKPELITPLRFAFAGACCLSMRELVTSIFQAMRRFLPLTLVQLISPILKLLEIGLLLLVSNLRLQPVLVVYISLPLLAAIIGSFLLPRQSLRGNGARKDVFWELFHFSKWVALSYISCIIYERLDIMMLTKFMPDMDEVGLYSLGFRLISPLLLLSSSLMLICTPLASRMTSPDQYRDYIHNILKIMLPVSLIFCLLFPFSPYLIQFVFNKTVVETAAATSIFRILLIGVIFQIVTAPLTLITYAESKPQIIAYADMARLFTNFTGNYLLINGNFGFPAMGIKGAAWATTITIFTGTSVVLGYIYWGVFRKHKQDEGD